MGLALRQLQQPGQSKSHTLSSTERGVRLDAVQRTPGRPTRDVYVTRDAQGDREFAGFGLPGTGSGYADAFIEPRQLPLDSIQVRAGTPSGVQAPLGSRTLSRKQRRPCPPFTRAPRSGAPCWSQAHWGCRTPPRGLRCGGRWRQHERLGRRCLWT
jgi:hypothetical protein